MKLYSKNLFTSLNCLSKSSFSLQQLTKFSHLSALMRLYYNISFKIYQAYFNFHFEKLQIKSENINSIEQKSASIFRGKPLDNQDNELSNSIMKITTFKRKKLKLKKHKTRKRERKIKNINKKNL